MKILSVSDFVEPGLNDPSGVGGFEGVDLILSCGDLPPEYLSSLVRRFNVPLFYVKGNHDIRYDSKPMEGCTDLNGRVIKYRGCNFLGLEGSHWYNGGIHQYTELQMRRTIRGLRLKIWSRGGLDVIVTHAPPRHIHDAEDPCHRGFASFRWLIRKYSPQYFVHGHIHALFSEPSQRVTIEHRTRVVNSYGHFLFEIDDKPTAS